MGNADMEVVAKLVEIKSEEATKDLQKKINEIFNNPKIRLDTSLLEKELSKAFENAGAKGALIIRNAISKEIKNAFNFGNAGNNFTKSFTTNYTSGLKSSLSVRGGHSKTVIHATEEFVENLLKAAEEAGATSKALQNLRKNFVKELSSFFVDKNDKASGSIPLDKGKYLNFTSGVTRKDNDIYLEGSPSADMGYSATQFGAPAFREALNNLREMDKQSKVIDKLKDKQENLNSSSKEYAKIQERIDEAIRKRQEAYDKIVEASKTVTVTQRRALTDAVQKKEDRAEVSKVSEEAKLQQEEQNKLLKEALALTNEINARKKQNIEYGEKANGRELIQLNNEQIALLEQQLKTKQKILTEDRNDVIAERQKKHYQEQQRLQQEKMLKLRSSRNTKGTFMDEVETAFGRVTTYGVAYNLVNMFKNKVKETIQVVTNFDKAMNNLRIVTRQSENEIKNLAQSYVDLAIKLGSTSEKVFEAADLWLRQGRSVAETNDLIAATIKMANIAQIDSAKSADILTSAINGFKLEAKDAMHVVDVFAAIDLAAAADTEELAEAMQRVAATAGEVGISIESITSYIATLVDATRLDSGTIGSAKCFWRKI